MIKVTVFSEDFDPQWHLPEAEKTYPQGLLKAIGEIFEDGGYETTLVGMPDDGDATNLTDEILNETDVLVWWGHRIHHKVSDEVCEKVVNRVLGGMGCIFLHSAHFSKPFRKLMGSTCSLRWREANERERVWCVNPTHPIAQGVPEQFELAHEEMYGEFFDIPKPDDIVFIGWFQGGEVFRSGVTYTRGKGKVFYFQPGHETYAAFHNEYVKKILTNAVEWAKPCEIGAPLDGRHIPEALEKI